jgi:hypothetical protein
VLAASCRVPYPFRMAANYGRPRPVDPLWYRFGWYLRIRCQCGHSLTQDLRTFAAERALPCTTRLYELHARLQCSQCQGRPELDVSSGMNG